MRTHFSGARALGVLATIVVACGGANDQTTTNEPETDDGHRPALVIADLAIAPDEPLAHAFERARQAYHRENIETFDPRRAYATSPARDFAWYFTINDPNDPAGRTHHVLFVVTEPWTEQRTRDFLLSYLVMPGAAPSEVGRLWFTVYSAYPLPRAVRFLFSNEPAAALESALLSEVGATRWTAEQVPELLSRVADIVARQLEVDGSQWTTTCPAVLDQLFPQPPPVRDGDDDGVFGADYVPEGTLAGVGLLLGESIRTALAGAAYWEDDEEEHFYPRLRVTGVAEGILRPIPMMIEFYLSDQRLLPTDYCRRILASLNVEVTSGGEQP